jgi:hypothetical protein
MSYFLFEPSDFRINTIGRLHKHLKFYLRFTPKIIRCVCFLLLHLVSVPWNPQYRPQTRSIAHKLIIQKSQTNLKFVVDFKQCVR